MIRHFILISWRNIVRHKFYSILLTLGLAIGIASCLLLGSYTWHELTFDDFHEKKDRIYLLAAGIKEGTEESTGGWTTPPSGPAVAEYYAEVESFARMCTWFDEMVVSRNNDKFVETGVKAADSSIFHVFTIPFIAGNPRTALKEPNSVVITRSMAQKYFGDTNAMGQTLNFDSFFRECVVTGIVEDYPGNSHFDFDMLVSLSSLSVIRFDFNHWMNHTFVTYVLLHPGADVASMNERMPGFIKANLDPYLIARYQKTYDEMYRNGDYYRLSFVPLKDVHLSTLLYDNQEGKQLMVYALGAIGVIILVLVCINYVNLATVLSFGRAREAGIRKVNGSIPAMLFRQFLIESAIMSLIGLVLALGIVELTLPMFNNLIGQTLSLQYTNPVVIAGLIGFALLVGVLSGLLPAVTFASFSPVAALKGLLSKGTSRPWLRNGLIVFQFTICIVMIASTIVVYKQFTFMTARNVGFAKDQVLILKRPEGLKGNKTVFKNELLKHAGIASVSYTETIPGREFNGHGQHFVGTPETEVPVVYPLVADPDIFATLGLQVVQGKAFTSDDIRRPRAILNETAVQKLGLEDPLSAKIDRGTMNNEVVDVIGVMKDFNFKSFYHQVEPLVVYSLDVENDPQHRTSYVLVRLAGGDIQSTIASIESKWKELAGNYPFEYTFLDQDFNRLFEGEIRMAKVYTLFSVISILIACLGLLGLISYFARRRNKEVGIRKIMGASLLTIVVLLSRDFIRLLMISIAIGSFVAWYLSGMWITKFVYQTELSWWVFAVSGGVIFMIAWITVGWQLYKTGKMNPVDTLRYE